MKILFEDDYIIAADKPAKQFVHPMPGEKESKTCLLFDVRDYFNDHVYAINRIDRPVSGIVLFAKAPDIVTKFQEIWHEESFNKIYNCLHRGRLDLPGQFDSPLSKQGAFKSDTKREKQDALTLYWPQQYFPNYFCTYTKVSIKTGRYHQIRRHFRKAIMPIIGDRKHGKGKVNKQFEDEFALNQIFLHCTSFFFKHPITQQNTEVESPLADNLKTVLEGLRKTEIIELQNGIE